MRFSSSSCFMYIFMNNILINKFVLFVYSEGSFLTKNSYPYNLLRPQPCQLVKKTEQFYTWLFYQSNQIVLLENETLKWEFSRS